MTKDLTTIEQSELTKSSDNVLNANQLSFLLQKTPENHIYERPAKGGGKWKFVTGVYVKKVLNLIFGWDWSFEVVEHKIDLQLKQAYVLGKLTVRSNNRDIVKMQFGRVDIKFKKAVDTDSGMRIPLDVGNDLKAATTDALKKCASELGIASDVYAPNEFKAIKVVEDTTTEDKIEEITLLLQVEGLTISEEDRMYINNIIEEKEDKSYAKCIKLLNSNLPKK